MPTTITRPRGPRIRRALTLVAVSALVASGALAAGSSPAHADACQPATVGFYHDPAATAGLRAIRTACGTTPGTYHLWVSLAEGRGERLLPGQVSSPPFGGGWVQAFWLTGTTWLHLELFITPRYIVAGGELATPSVSMAINQTLARG